MTKSNLFRQLIIILQKARRANLAEKGQPAPLPPQQQNFARWPRRRFLTMMALATGSALASKSFSAKVKSQTTPPQIAIIGGGIAGLNAAYQLKKAGLEATIYEGRNRLGGRIFSTTSSVGEDLVVNLGGSFINTDHEDLLNLVKDFNLQLFDRTDYFKNTPFPQTSYYFNGNRRSEAELVEKMRLLATQIASDADLIDQDAARFVPQFDQLSVTDYLNQHSDKIPEPFIRSLIESSIRSEFGVEPEESSAMQLLFNLPSVDGNYLDLVSNSDEHFTMEGGNTRLIDSLAEVLPGQIVLGSRLTKIEAKKAGFRLYFAENKAIDADWVILALPFTVLRNIEITVNLPSKLRRFINEVSLGFNEKLITGFNGQPWQQEQGFAGELWTDVDFCEAWDESQMYSTKALTFFFGGKQVPLLHSQKAKSRAKKILNQLEQIIPEVLSSANGQLIRTEWSKDPFTKGGYTSFKPGQLTEFSEFLYIESKNNEERQDVRIDNLIFAGEQFSDEFYGFMNGGAQTGRLAAEVIIRDVIQ